MTVYTAVETGISYRIPFSVINRMTCFQRIINNIIEKEKLQCTFANVDYVTIYSGNKNKQNLKLFLEVASRYRIFFNNSKSIIGIQENGIENIQGGIFF